MAKFETTIPDPFVEENSFRQKQYNQTDLPTFQEVRGMLPQPVWAAHQSTIDCYWKAWEIAFSNLRQPVPGSGFVSPFIDTAFNDCLFMWDSAFIMMFTRYARRAWDFQQTLDNFYAFQHKDGFICREIDESDGSDRFERFDPSSTGPNILPWAEWDHYLFTGDRERLEKVFPPLLAYYHWFRANRSWPDGSYWSSGLGCGMDNQPRLQRGYDVHFSHGHTTWIDTTIQQVLAAGHLAKMASVLGRSDEIANIIDEGKTLVSYVNEHLWDETSAFYYDRFRDGSLSDVRTIGAYWALLAGIVPQEGLERFTGHLNDASSFKRPHRVPSLPADQPDYVPLGSYWRGGVWAPTNYMLLRGLTNAGENMLAHEIAVNHLGNVVKVFEDTGTLWENYAPEEIRQGNRARDEFVGWTGLPPISVLFEYVFGLRPDTAENSLLWDLRLLDEHGVRQYPFGADGMVNLHCAGRASANEEPIITASANKPMTLLVRWEGGEKTLSVS